MKNLFGFDKKTKVFYRDVFISRTIDDSEAEEKLCAAYEEKSKAEKQATLPSWLVIVAWVLVFAGLIMLIPLGMYENEEEFEAVKTVAIAVGVVAAVGFCLLIINYILLQKLKASSYYQSLLEKENEAEKLCFESLKVPENAEDIDILAAYEDKKNPLFNAVSMKIFNENENLCLADECEVISVPLNEIKFIYLINKKTSFFALEKEIKKDERKELNLKLDKHRNYVLPCRYSVTVLHGAEEFEIAIPPYELDKIKKYVNATAIN